jgi:hypothetical protein
MTPEQKAEARLEAIKVAIRQEKDAGQPKQVLIDMTIFDNGLIEEVYSE